MELKLRTQYWDDNSARAAFKQFILEIHGLDFSDWESGGFWDDAFTPFSYFDGDKIVASACVYLLEAVVDGSKTHLVQVSSVGTLPKWRCKGLNRRLTAEGLEWARGKHDGVFLFSNPDAVSFYKKCGFSAIDEFVIMTEVTPVQNRGGLSKLNPGCRQDRDRIYDYAKRRAPVSDQFSILNAKLLMFHALYSLRDCVYEIPDLDCLVFFKRVNGTLNIYDIVSARIPHFEELYPHIAAEDDGVIVFHFNADKLRLNKAEARQLDGNNPFVKAPFPVEKPVFPFTSRA